MTYLKVLYVSINQVGLLSHHDRTTNSIKVGVLQTILLTFYSKWSHQFLHSETKLGCQKMFYFLACNRNF